MQIGDLVTTMGDSIVFQITQIDKLEVEGVIVGLSDCLIENGWNIGGVIDAPIELCKIYTGNISEDIRRIN